MNVDHNSQWPMTFHPTQVQASTNYGGNDPEVDLARRQMIESAAQLSQALRTAATNCDNFIKAVQRQAGGAAAGFPETFLSLGTPAPTSSGPGRKPMSKAEKAEQRKIRKANRDPTAPKRPPSAYLLFQNEVREEMRARHPGLNYSGVLGKVSEAWKNLTDEQRKVYQDKTTENMARWNSEKKAHSGATTADASSDFYGAPGTGDHFVDSVLTTGEVEAPPTPAPAPPAPTTSGKKKKKHHQQQA